MATPKQVNYVMMLLGRKGFSTKWMNASFADLGASMKERQGKVEDWVRSMDVGRASQLIDRLLNGK